MGNDEEGKSAKPEKSSPPATPDHASQANIHVYPDWAAMQAYYGPRVALPPYYNSAVASGHAPHPYMWGPPQPMMPPYGTPYAAIYPHGGVYAHPGVPLGSHGQGVPSSPAAVIPMSVETPTKSSGTTEKELVKKIKGFNALAMSIGSGNSEGVSEQRMSQSFETEGSSDGSDGNTAGANQSRRKRSREGTPTTGVEKTEDQANTVSAKDINVASDKALGLAVSPAGMTVGSVVSPGMTTALELRNSSNLNPVLPSDSWMNNERELKRERRKQSNRESARRSRLRKQAETEELGRKVETLNAENVSLKSELNRLTENSEKLRLENAKLMDKLKNAQLGRTEKIMLNNNDKPISTENLLSRVNNSGSIDRKTEEENGVYDKSANSGAKLHQLLDTSPRADVVAAG